jgi:hypothetical protein
MPPDAVDNYDLQIPSEYILEQNFPNPFNPMTSIRYELPEESYLSLKVYDVLGREVARLAEGNKPAGIYSVNWNASDFGSGIYIYRFEAVSDRNRKVNFTRTGKMILIK